MGIIDLGFLTSMQEGTRTSVPVVTPACDLPSPHCHMPFKLCQRDRWSCGRGYSGHGSVPTLLVQGVSKGGVFYGDIQVSNEPVVLMANENDYLRATHLDLITQCQCGEGDQSPHTGPHIEHSCEVV
jgi:hypothetical protein